MKLKARIKQKIKKVGEDIKKAANTVKDVVVRYNPATIASRNATLAAVRLNVAGLASKLYRAGKVRSSKAWQEIEKKWEQLGGKKDNLYSALQQGIRLEYKRHPNKHQEKTPVFNFDGEDITEYATIADEYLNFGYDTAEPVTTGAIAVAALPVVAALLNLLKKNGIDTTEEDKAYKGMADKALSDLAQAEADKLAAAGDDVPPEIKVPENAINIPDEESNMLPEVEIKATKINKKTGSDNDKIYLYGAIGIVIVVVILIATKKK